MLNTLNINLKTDIKNDRPTSLGIKLMSQDKNNNQFILRFTNGGEPVTLNDTYTVEILTKFQNSGASRLTSATVRQDYATWQFDTEYITQDETVHNFVYVRKAGSLVVSADANAFYFEVGLSEIDKDAGRVAEVYDKNYQKYLDEFKDNVDFEEIAQAEQARKDAEALREENYERKVDTAIVEADVVEKVDNKVTELTPQINNLTAQLAQKATKGEIKSSDFDVSSDGDKIKLINLADEVQQALTGNAPALSVIPYKSITKEKLGFTKIVSRNMFNKATVTAGKKIDRTTGILVDDVNFYASDFIEVDSNTEYVINSAYDGAYFDSSFNYVSGLQPTTLGAVYVFTTPSNVKYLKISVHNTFLDTLQMEIGNVRTAYEPYLSLIDSGEVEGVNDLKASVNDLKASDSDFGNALNLTSDIKNTNQSVTFNPDGTVQKITHTDKTTSEVVRDDIFTYTINLITEVRTLPNSATITYKYHLDTMQTEVI